MADEPQLSVLAQLIIRSEGPSEIPVLHGRRWSLNLVVAGTYHPIGRVVNAETVQEAATKLAERWWP